MGYYLIETDHKTSFSRADILNEAHFALRLKSSHLFYYKNMCVFDEYQFIVSIWESTVIPKFVNLNLIVLPAFH